MNKPTYVAFSTQKGEPEKRPSRCWSQVICTMSRVQRRSGRLRFSAVQHPRYAQAGYGYDHERRPLQGYGLNSSNGSTKTYPVVCSKPEDAADGAPCRIGGPSGFRLFRPAGHDQQSSIVKPQLWITFFCPIAADRVVMTSSMQFATVIDEHMISTGQNSYQGTASALEHGGRTRKDGTVFRL